MIRSDSGSILPIGIGVISISVIIALVLVEVIGVQYQTLENKQLADVAALKVATDLNQDGIAPVRNLEYQQVVFPVIQAASALLGISPVEVSVISQDERTIEAVVCSYWTSITGLRLGSIGKICSSSKARAISSVSR